MYRGPFRRQGRAKASPRPRQGLVKASPRPRQARVKVLHGKNGLPTPKKSAPGRVYWHNFSMCECSTYFFEQFARDWDDFRSI